MAYHQKGSITNKKHGCAYPNAKEWRYGISLIDLPFPVTQHTFCNMGFLHEQHTYRVLIKPIKNSGCLLFYTNLTIKSARSIGTHNYARSKINLIFSLLTLISKFWSACCRTAVVLKQQKI